jgi:hypothetical protein
MRALALALAAACASGRLLAPKEAPAVKAVPAKEAAKKAEPAKSASKKEAAPKEDTVKAKAKVAHQAVSAKANATKQAPKKAAPLTDEEQAQRLLQSLASIQKLRSKFVASAELDKDKSGMAEMASGALTAELGKQDSSVWSTIQNMLTATSKVTHDLKGKSEKEKEKLMTKLEGSLNASADNLRAVTDRTTKIQDKHSSEYLLGLLNQHKKWTLAQQLNATRTFEDGSEAAAKLLKTYNKSQSLAPQLATIMDEEAKAEAKSSSKAAKKAAMMFIQLVQGVVPAQKPAQAKAKQAAKSTPKAEQPVSEEEQLNRLQNGLVSIRKLKSTFQAEGKADDLQQFAQGAMTSELGKSDSSVWSTIETMLDATAAVTSQMKGKSQAEKEKLMTSLSDTLTKKAHNLQTAADSASKLNQEHSNEYLLGLLMQHTEWSEEKQLNATRKFAHDSPIITKLLAHHDETKPLAPQLAALMDKEKPGASKVAKESAVVKQLTKAAPKPAAKAETQAKTKAAKPEVAKAKVEKKAKMMLLQLVNTLRKEVAAF